MEMMTLSLTFQLGERSPDVTRHHPLLAIDAYDEGIAFVADKGCRLPFQKFGQQNHGGDLTLMTCLMPGETDC